MSLSAKRSGYPVAVTARGQAGLPFQITCHDSPARIRETWLVLEESSCCTVFESYHWCQNWVLHGAQGAGEQPLIIVGYDNAGAPAFLLPMALVRTSGVTLLTWLAQAYSCYNMPICPDDTMPFMTKEVLVSIFQVVRENYGFFDAMALTGQPEEWDGMTHMMQVFSPVPTGQVALTIPLQPSFDEMHDEKVSKSSKKKLRRKMRQLEQCGKVEFGIAKSRAERKKLYQAFLDYKAASLEKQGKANVYEQQFLNDFYCGLMEDGGSGQHLEQFYLSVDGDILAVSYGLYYKQNFFSISRAMKDSPLNRFSPGILLLMGELSVNCGKKMSFLDLGPGDSVYKKHWGYKKVMRFNCYHSFSARGRLYIGMQKMQLNILARLKDFRDSSPFGHLAGKMLSFLKKKNR